MDNLEMELDDLLDDIHKIIDEADTPVMPDEELPDLSAYLGEDFSEKTVVYEPEKDPERKPEPKHWTQTQRLPKHVAKLQQDQQQAYAEWLYAQGQKEAQTEEQQDVDEGDKPKKKKHVFRNIVLILLILAVLSLAAVVFVLPKQPVANSELGERRDGVTTILLAGTDSSSLRTDALMLLTVDVPAGSLSLVSIPRDTLVNGSYSVPKINSVYAANDGGEEGIEMLLTRVSECIGFRPDGYMLIHLDAFVEVVDAMGGVKFHVPVDMFYNDPSQDLYIDLKAGLQTLNGEQAMGVMRFRSGYADADLGRVEVQRDLLAAMVNQMVSLEGVAKSPQLLDILLKHTDTDLTVSNCLWLAERAAACDLNQVQTTTLPGTAKNLGGSYYVLDPELVAQTVNAYCNPYRTAVTTDHLNIRQG